MPRTIVLALGLALSGCSAAAYGVASVNAGEWSAVKERARAQAASDFSCNAEGVEVREVNGNCGGRVSRENGCMVWAIGCGKYAAYYQDEQKNWQRQGGVQSGPLPAALSAEAR